MLGIRNSGGDDGGDRGNCGAVGGPWGEHNGMDGIGRHGGGCGGGWCRKGDSIAQIKHDSEYYHTACVAKTAASRNRSVDSPCSPTTQPCKEHGFWFSDPNLAAGHR